MFDFLKRRKAPQPYDLKGRTPAVRASICTGEKVAGFIDERTGRFTEVGLIRDRADLEEFCRRAGVTPEEVRTFY